MITQAESGLGSSQYNEVKALKVDPAYKVIAKQMNPTWSQWTSSVVGGFSCAKIIGTTMYVWSNSLVFAIDMTTGTPTDVTPSTSIPLQTIVPNGPKLTLITQSGSTVILAACYDGIYENTLGVFSSWFPLYVVASQAFYSGNVARNGVADASSFYSSGTSSYPPSNAFDGAALGIQWATPIGTTTGWLRYDFGSYPRTIIKYSVTAGVGTSDPRDWTFEGSNNGSSWTTLDTRTAQTGWTVTRNFTFSNTTAYRYYRINISANNGATQMQFGELAMFELGNDQSIMMIAGVEDRCHFIYADAATRTFNLRMTKWFDGTATSSDIWLTDRPKNIEVTTDGTFDYVLIETEYPGKTTTVLEGTALKSKRLRARGLLCFKYNISEKKWSPHSIVDSVEDYDPTYNYVKNPRISYVNNTLFATALVGSGTAANAVSSYRMYQSKDGIDWSLPTALYFGANQLTGGALLLTDSNYVYAVEGSYVWRSPITDIFGTTNSSIQADITSYVSRLSINQGDITQVPMTLDNSTGWLDAHAFINDANWVKFDIYLGAYISDNTKQLYPITSVYMDSFERNEEVNGDEVRYTVDVSCRDNLSWMTDITAAEDQRLVDVYDIGADNFANTTKDVYGGLGHFATMVGEFNTINGALSIPMRNQANLSYGRSTLIDSMWNGSVQVGMFFSGMTASQAGIIFRGQSTNTAHRFWFWYYNQTDDKLHLAYHDNSASSGVSAQVDVYVSAIKSWSGITSGYKHLRVEMFYGNAYLYYSSDNITWTLETTYKMDVSLKQIPDAVNYDSTILAYDYMEAGYVGVGGLPTAASVSGAIYFINLTVTDYGRPMTVERACKLYSNYANVNTWSFDNLYTGGTTNWSLGSGVSVAAGPAFTSTASPSGWRDAIQTGVEIPTNHTITFDVTGYGWGVITRRVGSTHWLIGLDASGHPTFEIWNGSAYVQQNSRPSTFSNSVNYKVQVCFQEIRYGKDTNIWNAVSMWINDRLAISYILNTTTLINTTMHIGFAIRESSTKTFSNVRVPELCDIAEAITIDQGESPMSGLQRSIEGRYLQMFSRYNGAFRVYRPKQQSSLFTLATGESHRYSFSKNTIKNHIRMVGAYEYAESMRTDLIAKYGHLFAEMQNPYLMSEWECLREAQQAIKRLEENAVNESMQYSYQHFMEIGDRITLFGNARTVRSVNIDQTPVQTMMQLQAKGYTYG